jgi:Cu-Zn family superoxide dismutase
MKEAPNHGPKEIKMRHLVLAALVLCGCAAERSGSPSPSPSTTPGSEQAPSQAAPPAATATVNPAGATATLAPTEGNQARGTVSFEPTPTGVRMSARLEGLPPGEHGFHVHEEGDCSAPDASSAGAHFNPTQHAHGAPDAPQHHVGDLGNVTADASGTLQAVRTFEGVALEGDQGIVGRAVIVHASADDFTTQPTGNAGARLACGVIRSNRPRDRGDD